MYFRDFSKKVVLEKPGKHKFVPKMFVGHAGYPDKNMCFKNN